MGAAAIISEAVDRSSSPAALARLRAPRVRQHRCPDGHDQIDLRQRQPRGEPHEALDRPIPRIVDFARSDKPCVAAAGTAGDARKIASAALCLITVRCRFCPIPPLDLRHEIPRRIKAVRKTSCPNEPSIDRRSATRAAEASPRFFLDGGDE
jgi:hypothetical protein